MTPQTFLAELEPVAAKLLDRHLATTKEWFPHELVPYGRGRDFEQGYEWSADDGDLGGAVLPEAVSRFTKSALRTASGSTAPPRLPSSADHS